MIIWIDPNKMSNLHPLRKWGQEIEHQSNRILNKNSTNGTRPVKASRTSAPKATPSQKRGPGEASELKPSSKRARLQLANQDAIDAYERTSRSRRLADRLTTHGISQVTQQPGQQTDIDAIIALF